MTRIRLLSPWRRRFQWVTSLLIILVPWMRADGKSLLRIDIPELSFYFFGQTLRIEELYLLLLACLTLVLGFLLATLVFGRVWCGWACPQTTLNDIAEWLARRLKVNVANNRLTGTAWRKGVLHLGYAALAFLVAANLLWYFVDPRDFFAGLAGGTLHYATWTTLLIGLATVYLDLAFIRRLMCSDFCPYGRIQTSLVDPGTLTLHIPDTEIDRCINCRACVRVCPMEIDIRQGYQVECINCGRCLDACRKVMAPRREEGLIRYSFGLENRGVKALLNPRTLLVTLATLAIASILLVATFNRLTASIKVSRSHLVADRILENGQQATFFNAWINNRGETEMLYDVVATDLTDGSQQQTRGQTKKLMVPGGGNLKVDFVLVTPPSTAERKILFDLKNEQGESVAKASASISPVTE